MVVIFIFSFWVSLNSEKAWLLCVWMRVYVFMYIFNLPLVFISSEKWQQSREVWEGTYRTSSAHHATLCSTQAQKGCKWMFVNLRKVILGLAHQHSLLALHSGSVLPESRLQVFFQRTQSVLIHSIFNRMTSQWGTIDLSSIASCCTHTCMETILLAWTWGVEAGEQGRGGPLLPLASLTNRTSTTAWLWPVSPPCFLFAWPGGAEAGEQGRGGPLLPLASLTNRTSTTARRLPVTPPPPPPPPFHFFTSLPGADAGASDRGGGEVLPPAS